MHFERFTRTPAYTWTKRKEAALRRKIRLKEGRDLLPGEAERVAAKRAVEAEDFETSFRNRQAQGWRNARRRLRRLPPELKAQALAAWNSKIYPGSPEYLSDLVTQIQRRDSLLDFR